jgi:hypothetical protein
VVIVAVSILVTTFLVVFILEEGYPSHHTREAYIVGLAALLAVELVVLAMVFLWRWSAERARLRRMRRLAEKMGLMYSLRIDLDALVPFYDLLLFGFSRDCAWEACDWLRGQVGGFSVWILEFHFVGAFRTWEHVVRRYEEGQTIVLLPDAGKFPSFHFAPAEGKWDEMMPAWHVLLGAGDPVLALGKEGDRPTLVYADEGQAVRQLFSSRRLALLGDLSGWVIECRAGNLLVYQPGKVATETELPALLHRAVEIARVLGDPLPATDPPLPPAHRPASASTPPPWVVGDRP